MFPGCLLLIQFLSLLINVAADQAPGYSALDNGQGETPCQMMSSIENCSGALKLRDATGASPSPTKCTCTNVYFNVWSACLLSTGTANSLALSNNWTSTCEQQGITLVTDQYSSSNSLGLPPWAFTSLPVNQSFNIAAALQAANTSTPTKWNQVQIVAPVIVGVVVSAAFIVGFLIWHSKKSGSPSVVHRMRVAMSRIIRGGFGASRIKTGSREPQWVIDRPVEANHELERLSNASSRRSTGHVRLSSSSDNLDFVKPQKGTWSMPGKNLWKNSPLARRIGRTAILPWKSAPASVKPVMPSRRFEIDASSERTRTDSTLENYRRGGFRLWGSRTETTDSVFLTSPIFEYHEAGQTIFEEDEEENDSDLDLGGMNLGGMNIVRENEQLISEPSDSHNQLDDVMIISETGDNFTIDSPSTSSPSHRIPPSPVRPRSDSPVQRIPPPPRTPDRSSKASRRAPPAPSYPAPTPPPVPSRPHSSRSLPRKMLNKPSNESMPSTATPPSRSPPQKRNLPLLPVPDSTASSAYPSRPLNDSPVPTPVPLPPPPTSPPIVANTQYPASSHPTSRPRPPIPQRPHKHNPSNSTESFPFISSPPYRSSPLPEEVRIARSGSPPPPPSNPSSPGYNITTFASRMGGGFNQIPPMPSSPPYNTTTLPSSRLAGGVSHKPPSSPPYNTTTFSSRLASGVSRTPPVPSSPPYNTTTLPSSRLAVGGSRTPPMPSSPPYNTTNLPSSRLGSSVSRTPPVPSSPPYNTMTLPSSRLGGGVTRTPPLSPPYNTATLSSSRFGGGVSHTPPAPALTSPMQHHRLMSLPTHGYTGGDPGITRFGSPDGGAPPSSTSQSGVANHRGYPFEATLAPPAHFRSFSADSAGSGSINNSNVDDSPVDPWLLFPGPVRGTGYISPGSPRPDGSPRPGGFAGSSTDLRSQASYDSFQSKSTLSLPRTQDSR